MGVPAYFSHIIKKHRTIIYNLSILTNNHISNLLMDCNSIIYDCVHSLPDQLNADFEDRLIKAVCNKIDYYITLLKPQNKIYISFDGVAPFAKMDQQRTRRCKSYFQSKVESIIDPQIQDKWNTANITPGTTFMNKLSIRIHVQFDKHCIVSTSTEAGEGEHKLFSDIRSDPNYSSQTTVIYGLDADLIMLSLSHIKYCDKILLFRETPDFIQSIDSTLNPNELYGFNINELSSKLKNELNNGDDNRSVIDYVFLCFMLGNDFIPHIPCINIRTNGINQIMDVYNSLMNNGEYMISESMEVNWTIFKQFINKLSVNELDYYTLEYSIRTKQSRRILPSTSVKDKLAKFNYIPLYNREQEHYIEPGSDHWKHRYYKILFNKEYIPNNIKDICINYLEALEWTLKYYTTGCQDWRWSYKYHYPPLMSDLVHHVPYINNTTMVLYRNPNPVKDYVQLAYVLPKQYLTLLPSGMDSLLLENVPYYYPTNFTFTWCYCKYFWEAHINIPPIDIKNIESILL
jgi:5'-3' exoribonuclease 1